MTQATDPLTLYDRDLDLQLEAVILQLKAGDFENIDIENLIEELEGLSGSHKREVETRLKRLIEYILNMRQLFLIHCSLALMLMKY